MIRLPWKFHFKFGKIKNEENNFEPSRFCVTQKLFVITKGVLQNLLFSNTYDIEDRDLLCNLKIIFRFGKIFRRK